METEISLNDLAGSIEYVILAGDGYERVLRIHPDVSIGNN